MAKEEITSSEWQIMEVLWASSTPLTSSEVYKRMQRNKCNGGIATEL